MVKGAKQMQPLSKFEITLGLGSFYIWAWEEELPFYLLSQENLHKLTGISARKGVTICMKMGMMSWLKLWFFFHKQIC